MSVQTHMREQALLATNLDAVDTALRPLLPAVQQSLRERRPVLAVQLWQPIPCVALLPFHLQLRWPDQVDALPLNLTMGMAPYRQADRALADIPLYAPELVYDQTRMVARWYRTETGTVLPGDLELQDWEVGYRRHKASLQGRLLPGAAYIVVGKVANSADIVRTSSRPVLGRFLGRRAPRPLLLVPGTHADTDAAQARLVEADYLILNMQGIGGKHARQLLAALLARRQTSPTLCVAASPTDILALAQEHPIASALPLLLMGTPPPLSEVSVQVVGRDRPQEEVRFDDTVTSLRGYDTRLEPLLDLAEHTWWSVRQSLWADNETGGRLLLPYRRMLERIQRNAPYEIGVLTSATHLLEQTAADAVRAEERLAAVVHAVEEQLTRTGVRKTLVAVADGADVVRLRHHLCTQFGLDAEQLHTTGITLRTVQAAVGEQCDTLIAVGYQGIRTLDAPLFTRARTAHFIVDPIEARVAVAHLSQLMQLFEPAQRTQTHPAQPCLPVQNNVIQVLTLLRERFMSVAASGQRVRLTIGFMLPSVSAAAAIGQHTAPDDTQKRAEDSALQDAEVFITCTDGMSFLWPVSRRVEVLDTSVGGLRAIQAGDLIPGDEMIVVARESQELFSDQLLRSLDEGELSRERAARDKWLLLVGGMRRVEQRTFKSIHAGLHARGCTVSLVTVRSWVPDPGQTTDGLVPRKWPEFLALAQELHVPMEEAELRATYQAIKRWRVLHRSYGRRLVRVMRYAALGHLDAVTLARIQRRWGWRTRDLVAGISLHVVEASTPA